MHGRNRFILLSSNTLTFGAQVEQVGEPPPLYCSPFVYEMEEFPEALALNRAELQVLYRRLSSFQAVANVVGASETFVCQSIQGKTYKHARHATRPSSKSLT